MVSRNKIKGVAGLIGPGGGKTADVATVAR